MGEVFDAGKRQLREVLVPRTEVEFIAADTPLAAAAEIAAAAPHSRFPVYQESYDDVIGFVHVRDLLNPGLAGRAVPVGEVSRPVKQLPTSKRVLSALSEMRAGPRHLAIVVDEYGGTAGIVTLEDLVEELIGDIRDEYDVEERPARPAARRRARGRRPAEPGRLRRADRGRSCPRARTRRWRATCSPRSASCRGSGTRWRCDGHKLTVTELDGRRIARVRVGRVGQADADGAAGGTAASPAPSGRPPARLRRLAAAGTP